ncbi:MAG: 16S rRNA (uracil(1498)-N(3))-methyltransferase [Phycisphaerae bacterium]|nr:16S rRNA (uracil(1498)-N(3))-methyltransferase [Phycisphaerae bacterium]
MSIHRVYWPGVPPDVGGEIKIMGEEARHALRVKRVRPGEMVELLCGDGEVASTRVVDAGRETLRLEVVARRRVPRPRPEVEVWTATPKGGRADEMIEGLSEVGAAGWRPIRTERGVVDPRANKLDRLARLAVESSKQCGRAWLMVIGPAATWDEALRAEGVSIVLADAAAPPYRALGAERIRLLVGPEGGWTESERAAAGDAGIRCAGFGPHVMRLETAAVVGAAAIVAAESAANNDAPDHDP